MLALALVIAVAAVLTFATPSARWYYAVGVMLLCYFVPIFVVVVVFAAAVTAVCYLIFIN